MIAGSRRLASLGGAVTLLSVALAGVLAEGSSSAPLPVKAESPATDPNVASEITDGPVCLAAAPKGFRAPQAEGPVVRNVGQIRLELRAPGPRHWCSVNSNQPFRLRCVFWGPAKADVDAGGAKRQSFFVPVGWIGLLDMTSRAKTSCRMVSKSADANGRQLAAALRSAAAHDHTAFTFIAGSQAPSVKSPAASTIASFDWTYLAQPEPGNRHWSSPDGVTWTETYSSGRQEVQKVAFMATLNGCIGAVTTKSYAPTAETFIPEPGCPNMVLLFRFGGVWGVLGRMRTIVARTDR